MPSFLQNPDKKTDEVKVLLTIVVVHCVDYNTFRASLIFSCLLVLPIQWIILKEQVKIKYDPYTLEPLADNNEYFESQFFLTLLYIFTTVEILLYNRTVKTMLRTNISGVFSQSLTNTVVTPMYRLMTGTTNIE